MAPSGRSGEDDDLSEVPLDDLLTGIADDHHEATDAGYAQYRKLRTMGRKAAEAHDRRGLSWRQISERTGLSTRTLHRYAKPFLEKPAD